MTVSFATGIILLWEAIKPVHPTVLVVTAFKKEAWIPIQVLPAKQADLQALPAKQSTAPIMKIICVWQIRLVLADTLPINLNKPNVLLLNLDNFSIVVSKSLHT